MAKKGLPDWAKPSKPEAPKADDYAKQMAQRSSDRAAGSGKRKLTPKQLEAKKKAAVQRAAKKLEPRTPKPKSKPSVARTAAKVAGAVASATPAGRVAKIGHGLYKAGKAMYEASKAERATKATRVNKDAGQAAAGKVKADAAKPVTREGPRTPRTVRYENQYGKPGRQGPSKRRGPRKIQTSKEAVDAAAKALERAKARRQGK